MHAFMYVCIYLFIYLSLFNELIVKKEWPLLID